MILLIGNNEVNQLRHHLLPVLLTCWHWLRCIRCCAINNKGDILDRVIDLFSQMASVLTVIHAVWRVPFIVATRPWKSWLERSKHVKQGPTKNHSVVDVDVLHHEDTCIANAWWSKKHEHQRIGMPSFYVGMDYDNPETIIYFIKYWKVLQLGRDNLHFLLLKSNTVVVKDAAILTLEKWTDFPCCDSSLTRILSHANLQNKSWDSSHDQANQVGDEKTTCSFEISVKPNVFE